MAPKRKSAAVSSSALAGLTFCMTGTISVSRAEMESFIQANGGDIAKSVTNKCTHLISAETGTKKCIDAEKKGVIVVDEDWVRGQCGNDAPEPPPKKGTKKEKAAPKKAAASSTGPLAGLTFCMTGTMSVSRAEMEKYIQDNGGDIAKTVTNSCSHLISAQLGTKKCQDAEKKGVIVVSEDWVREQCGDGNEMEEEENDDEEEEIVEEPSQKAKKASKKTVSANTGGDSIYMECSSSSGGKFWQCNLDGSTTAVTYGKIGSAGATQVKDHGDEESARKFFDKMVNEKSKKGYDEVENDAPDLVVKGKKAKLEKEKPAKPSNKSSTTKASSGASDSIHLECPSSSGGKFWECALDGTSTTVTYGKVGAAGSTQIKDHGSEDAARKFFDKMVKEKSKKGYS